MKEDPTKNTPSAALTLIVIAIYFVITTALLWIGLLILEQVPWFEHVNGASATGKEKVAGALAYIALVALSVSLAYLITSRAVKKVFSASLRE